MSRKGTDRTPGKALAVCGILTALSVVILLLGAAIGIGIYLAPMIAGGALLLIRRSCGLRYQVLVWIAVSLLSLMLVPEPEQNLMYLCVFGSYPIFYPWLQRRGRGLRLLLKLLYFNVVFSAVELLLMLVLVPETVDTLLFLLLLLLGNAAFFCYDAVLPRFVRLLSRYLGNYL